MSDIPAGFSGTHHIDGSTCTYAFERKCSHVTHGELAGVQFDENHNPIVKDDLTGDSMTNTIDDRERIEMALSLGFDPETSEPLTATRKAELEAALAATAPVAAHPTAPGPQPGGQPDIQALVQQEIAKALGGVPTGAPQRFEDVLNQIDPRDSEAALAMLDWLSKNQRLQVIGSLNGGGYLFHYQEPKGTTKQGYMPGSTKGGRMVDQAVDQARASGAKPRQTSMCSKCFSAVELQDDGTVSLDGDPTQVTCNDGGPHNFG